MEIEMNSKKKKKKKIVVLVILIIVLLAIISSGLYFMFFKLEPKKVVPKEPVKTLKIVDENSNERPLAIMIDNNVGSSSHKGLQDAYISYEAIVEGGLTRIMVLYKDKELDNIGPIRSSRHYFLDYALESDAIYAHFGWSPYARNDIKTLGVNNINGLYDSKPFWRVSDYDAPHNVFTATGKLYSYAKELNYKTETDDWKLLNYNVDEVNLLKKYPNNTNVMTANKITFEFSDLESRKYTYDSANKYYLRSMNDEHHIDATTKRTYHYKNIIIEKVPNNVIDSHGRQDLETTGTGKGFYITNGYAIPITWQKDSRSSKTKYTYNNTEIEINDGNTFIEVIPTTEDVSITE